MDWYQVKLFIAHSAGASMDALHVVVGLCIQLLVGATFRTPVSRWLPWLVVLAITMINEANDLWVEVWPDFGMQWGEAAKDIMLTMMLPTLLLLAARRKPQLFVSGPRAPDTSDQRQLAFDFD